MIKIEKLVFNPFMENTYIIYDDEGNALIVDPGCYTKSEKDALDNFIVEKQLHPKAQIYTHCHIDHVLGMSHVLKKYALPPIVHPESIKLFDGLKQHGEMFGIEIDEVIVPEDFIEEGDTFTLGNTSFEIFYTPGHVDGHICIVDRANEFVVVGDVIFKDSIGRTDLPTGDFDLLARSIRSKIYTLPDEFVIYPGHGPATTVGYEKRNNPFVTGSL